MHQRPLRTARALGSLSRTSWIQAGIGRIFSPPFTAHALMFRLPDQDCAILVNHAPPRPAEMREHADLQLATVVFSEPESIYVRYAASARVPVARLAKSTPRQFPLERECDVQIPCERVILTITWDVLAMEHLCVPGARVSREAQYRIAHSRYVVRSRRRVHELGQEVPLAAQARWPCWRLEACDQQTRACYDVDSTSDWSLLACEMQTEARPSVLMRCEPRELRRRTQRSRTQR
jgi:hypothetical protein